MAQDMYCNACGYYWDDLTESQCPVCGSFDTTDIGYRPGEEPPFEDYEEDVDDEDYNAYA